jgi:hypothetical protein
MARIGIVVGLLLFGLTIAGMSMTTQKSYTQFIPMMFGIPMLFFGVVALNPHRRAEAVFGALLLALVGLVLGAGRTVMLSISWTIGGHVNSLSFQLVAAMTTVCGIFVIVAERWRRNRLKPPKNNKTTLQPTTAANSVVNPIAADPVTRPSVGSENPYQPPTLLDEPKSASAPQPVSTSKTSSSQPTDSSAK